VGSNPAQPNFLVFRFVAAVKDLRFVISLLCSKHGSVLKRYSVSAKTKWILESFNSRRFDKSSQVESKN
jgi:hypothetical protein